MLLISVIKIKGGMLTSSLTILERADIQIFLRLRVILTGKRCGWKSNSMLVDPISQVCFSIRSMARGRNLDEGKETEAKFVFTLLEA